MIDLNEICLDTRSDKIRHFVCFHKEASIVFKYFRFN